ncbi:MAG: DUF2950 domain-containing protein [Acidobacteriota bacterium]|nr:DUF2950 domain-containing protein [Acidobacteriota bacterium]
MFSLNRKTSYCWTFVALFALTISLASCSKKPESAPAEAAQKTFASSDDAGKALVDAARSGDQTAMLAIFGPGSKDLIYSGDAQEDKASFEGFVKSYDAMHRWRKLDDKTESLLVGTDNHTFPIPLMKNGSGQWAFDTAAGKEEIIARRIGHNEMAAIDVCAALADAQAEYFAQRRDGVKQYAQKFISDEGKENGLYWPPADGKPHSPIGPLVAFATEEGYKVQQAQYAPFHGYYFHKLLKQGPDAKGGAKDYMVNGKMTGGFAYVAYPAEYGTSGLKTFLINQQRVVYEKDLGKTTGEVAGAMTDFNPDKSWEKVGD